MEVDNTQVNRGNEAEIAAAVEQEKKLFNKARARAAFKIHLIIYLLVNALFWIIWYFVFRGTEANNLFFRSILFVTLAWAVIAIGHYVFVFVFNATMVEKELKKLKKQIAKDEEKLKVLQTIANEKHAELLNQDAKPSENQ